MGIHVTVFQVIVDDLDDPDEKTGTVDGKNYATVFLKEVEVIEVLVQEVTVWTVFKDTDPEDFKEHKEN